MKKFFTLELAYEFYSESQTLKLPLHLRNQYMKACASIVQNLSEGSAKPTVADRRKFYFIALASFRECQSVLRLHGSRTGNVILEKSDFLGACLYKLCKNTV